MSTFALETYLAERKAWVEEALRDRLSVLAPAVPPRLHESIAYSVEAGGKRLRPILCLAFAEAAGGAVGLAGRRPIDAACAVELVHTYSLVHDDLPAMDDDDLRRGKPTNHKVFGEAMAILAGDALQTFAFELLATGNEPNRARLCLELAQASGAAGMVGGQVLDIAEDRPSEVGYLDRLHRMKTGALIRAACRLGVLAVDGSAGALEAATVYGDAVGLVFQIADDLLDVTSTADALGKPTGADAAAGRHTYPAVLGVEAARRRAEAEVERAVAALAQLEAAPGPLAALARYALERRS